MPACSNWYIDTYMPVHYNLLLKACVPVYCICYTEGTTSVETCYLDTRGLPI